MFKSFLLRITRKKKRDQLSDNQSREILHGTNLLDKQVYLAGTKILPLKIFKFKELSLATNGFSLSTNGFRYNNDESTSRWFYGFRANIDGVQVLINQSKSSDVMLHYNMVATTLQNMCLNEISIHSIIHHRNIIKLLGCCLDASDPFLVLEFFPNGTLEDLIEAQLHVSWPNRLRIAIGIAEALAYLHHYGKTPIIHRNVIHRYIYLDDDYNPKLSGFTLAVSKPKNQEESSSIPISGTLLYMDPEYSQYNILTEKVDVYSFGMLLLVLFTWEVPSRIDSEEDLALTTFMSISRSLGLDLNVDDDWWLFHMIQNCFPTIWNTDIVLGEGVTREQLRGFLQLVRRCLKYHGEHRPTMKEVVRELRRMIEQT